jgi:hypothetical protein
MTNSISVDVDGMEEVLAMLNRVDSNVMFKVTDKAMRKANKIVERRAKQLAPRSSVTGSAKKRAKRQSESADFDYPLHKSITSRVWKHENGAVGVIGPGWPRGNKAFFNSARKGRRVFYWGKPQGTTYRQEDWLKRSLDETSREVEQTLVDEIRDAINEVERG